MIVLLAYIIDCMDCSGHTTVDYILAVGTADYTLVADTAEYNPVAGTVDYILAADRKEMAVEC